LLEGKTQQTIDKCWVAPIVSTQPTSIASAAISHFINFSFLSYKTGWAQMAIAPIASTGDNEIGYTNFA
jgi:hypothetical protein